MQNRDLKIDILIGADFYWFFVKNTIVRGNHFDPITIRSKLGFLLSDPMNIKSNNQHCSVNTAHVMFFGSDSSPKSLLKQSMTSIWGVGEISECNFEVVDSFRCTIK